MEMHTAATSQGCGARIRQANSTVFAATPAADQSKSVVRLFGVRLTDYQSFCNQDMNVQGMMRKSMSMGNLGLMRCKSVQRHSEHIVQSHMDNIAALRPSAEPRLSNIAAHSEAAQQGYASDGQLMQTSCNILGSRERRKGVPWTEEEHRLFLAGLQKLGKGDWRGISRNFVTSRTPTQVASHAQKYYLRQCNLNKRKRRSSLFDIINSNTIPLSSSTSTLDQEHPNYGQLLATELNQPIWELGRRHWPLTPSSSLMNPSSPFAKPHVSTIPHVSADLCLGRSPALQSHRPHVSAHDLLSLQSAGHQGKQDFATDAFLVCNKAIGLDAGRGAELDKPVMTVSSSSSSSRSLPSSPSSSSLCRIDEASELSSLNLSIAPPMPMTYHTSELTLKLEPPVGSRSQPAVFSSTTKICV